MQDPAKKAIVVGAGIIGLASALRLAEAGYAVQIIEGEDEVCAGSSQANAGQLLYDRIGAMGSPGFLKGLPGSMLDADQGVCALGLGHPKKWQWAGAFLRQCTTHRWQQNTQGLLELAARSRKAMQEVQGHYKLAFDWRKPGKLIVYPTQSALGAAALSAQFQAQFGGQHQVLGREGCYTKEPALRASKRTIAGGIYLPDAEIGDCCKFGQELAKVLHKKFGVKIMFSEKVLKLDIAEGRIVALQTDKNIYSGGVIVLATGKAIHDLLPRNSAIVKPVVGVKGISLTYPIGTAPPDLSVTDAAGKFVVMRLGDKVRVAGYAVFEDGEDIKPQYVERLAKKAQALMPQAADYTAKPDIWVGIRPQTPDDLPMIGACGPANLFVNAGHGSLGWTLALGSADVLVEKVSAQE